MVYTRAQVRRMESQVHTFEQAPVNELDLTVGTGNETLGDSNLEKNSSSDVPEVFENSVATASIENANRETEHTLSAMNDVTRPHSDTVSVATELNEGQPEEVTDQDKESDTGLFSAERMSPPVIPTPASPTIQFSLEMFKSIFNELKQDLANSNSKLQQELQASLESSNSQLEKSNRELAKKNRTV